MEKEDNQHIAATSTLKGGATQIVLPKIKYSVRTVALRSRR